MNKSNSKNTTIEGGTDGNASPSMSTSDCCKDVSKGASKSNISLDIIGQLWNMSTADDNISICANCGKVGDDVNNTCNKCKQVKYCNAVCKKKHRHKHKKECEEHVRLATEKHNEELRLAAERAAELHDEKLFKQPPLVYEDCPICFLRMPALGAGSKYQTCCGKRLCSGCFYAPVYDSQGNIVDNEKCPFCRTPWPNTDEEVIERLKKRVEAGDAQAMHNLGSYYSGGMYGLPQDSDKALELWHQAGELGYAESYTSIGYSYDNGRGVEVDETRANHYYEQAAMGGSETARHNLGNSEAEAGNTDRALKHYMIATRDGYTKSLNYIKDFYSKGFATKGDYMKALKLYQQYLGEIKSRQRGEAAAFSDEYRYH